MHPDTFQFLDELAANNNKSWFVAHKGRFDAIMEEFTAFTQDCVGEMSKRDTSLGQPDAKRCIYRIYRDLRFTQDKRPYKDHIAFFIPSGGVKRCGVPGYYLQIMRGDCSLGGGIFAPEPKAVEAIRQEIFYNEEAFGAICNDAEFRHYYGEEFWDWQPTKTIPKDYPKDWPYANWLKHRNWVSFHHFDDKLITGPSDKLFNYVINAFNATVPLNKFLLSALL
ncbi:MAG: DUF2461 domain-containing protein [Bacteroidales bacterium]|nr:DUF2461 domain-containing protein [Bacteroidales bacterium]